MRVGILSDTHGLLRLQVKDVLKTCDVILHGGDINRETIIKELEAFAPLYVVRGNNDKEWAEGLPEELSFSLEGVSFYMVHNKKGLPTKVYPAPMWLCMAIPTATTNGSSTARSG